MVADTWGEGGGAIVLQFVVMSEAETEPTE